MKLLLASSGFTNESIIAACERLAGKSRSEINIIIINEAIKAEAGDHRWFAESLQEITSNFGGNIEFIDLQAHDLSYITARIDAADVIFCFGGNTDYLADVFRQTGFDQILPQILSKKVWVGSSAGSCVLCHHESREASKQIFLETPSDTQLMNIVPIVLLPHFHSWFKFDAPEIIHESTLTDLPVYALSDQSALEATQDSAGNWQFQIVGQDYLVAKHGKLTS